MRMLSNLAEAILAGNHSQTKPMGELQRHILHHSSGDPKDTHLIFSASNSLCGGRLNFFFLAIQSFCERKGAWVGR